jgi:hypothetical protein
LWQSSWGVATTTQWSHAVAVFLQDSELRNLVLDAFDSRTETDHIRMSLHFHKLNMKML